MPPKPKFTREEIVGAALEVIRRDGVNALTARSLANELGSSSRPIFTVFKDMDDLKAAVRCAARNRFLKVVDDAKQYTPAFKQFVIESMRFANEESELFQLIFLTPDGTSRTFEELTLYYDSFVGDLLTIIQKDYDVDEGAARILLEHTWVYIHGIGSTIALRRGTATNEELNELLGQVFMAMIAHIKAGRIHERTPVPTRVDARKASE